MTVSEDLAAGLAIDAATRTVTSALPWPLDWIAQRLSGDRMAAVKAATRANPYAAVPSGTQLAIAAGQARANALRAGFPGLAGSDADWDHDQGASSVGSTGFRGQDLTALPIAPSRMLPYTAQGHPRDDNTTRGYTGPVITPGSPLLRWGATTRFPFPRIIAGTLLPPGARTPTPREMVAGYVATNPNGLRIDDPYLIPEDMD